VCLFASVNISCLCSAYTNIILLIYRETAINGQLVLIVQVFYGSKIEIEKMEEGRTTYLYVVSFFRVGKGGGTYYVRRRQGGYAHLGVECLHSVGS